MNPPVMIITSRIKVNCPVCASYNVVPMTNCGNANLDNTYITCQDCECSSLIEMHINAQCEAAIVVKALS